ncbi:flagellar hook-length control protein FliK [Neobacillus niacini]|uniref:flagellar hook-length control protein FliK n=1 Tax=Neobacillus niacini TaxID=86668 RepID=UPI002FFF42F2
MDITQFFIKINQNNIPEAGIPKLSKQTEAQGKSFSQILSMFSFHEQSPPIEGENKSPSTFIQTSNNQMNKVDLMKLKEEDLLELESIMTQFLGEIKKFTDLPTSEGPSNFLVNNEVQVSEELTANNYIQQSKLDLSKQFENWVQKKEGSNVTFSSDFAQVMKKLELLVNELQSSNYESHFETNHDIIQNIKMSFEEINSTFGKNQQDNIRSLQELDMPLNFKVKKEEVLQNDLRSGRQFKARDSENEVSLNIEDTIEYKLDNLRVSKLENSFPVYLDGKQSVNLEDKTPIMTASEPFTQEETFLISKNFDEFSDSKAQTVMVTNSLSRLDAAEGNKTSSSTHPLSLADFVPEVNDFAGRYLRILNGQSGSTEAKFNLFPEHLGHLEVKIISQEGQVSVQIVTDSSVAKDSLEGQLQQLRHSLQTQGLQVQKLEIIQQPPVVLDSSQASLSFSQGGSGSSDRQPSYYLGHEDSKKQQSDGDEKEKEMEQVSITYGGATPKLATRIDFTA